MAEMGSREVLVEMKYAPINPADINIIEGKYASLPELPFIPGNEGVGTVSQIGSDVDTIRPGQNVICPFHTGFWCEAYIANQDTLIPLPCGLAAEQGSMLAVNPPTAWLLLNEFVALNPGDWIIQNAANSAVGRLIIQIADIHGIHTINVVRRKELVPELKALGGTIVITDEEQFSKDIRDLTDGALVKLGLNATGGTCALEIAKSLASGSPLVTYGAMSRSPLQISNALLIFRDIRFRGFWRTKWFNDNSRRKIRELFTQLIKLSLHNGLTVPIEHCYALTEVHAAVRHAQRSKRSGKILLRI